MIRWMRVGFLLAQPAAHFGNDKKRMQRAILSMPHAVAVYGMHCNPRSLLSCHTGANVGKIVGKAPKLLLQSPEKIAQDADLVSAATVYR